VAPRAGLAEELVMTTQADWLQYVMSGNMVESACRIGAQHAAWAINNAGLGKGGQPAGVNADHKIVGKMGELAAAAFFRRLVTGLNDPKRRDLDDYIEVRSTEKRDWHLILANDPEEKRVADYLKVSLRQVQRLKVARSFIGRLPRYAKDDIDELMANSRRETSNVRRTPRGVLRVTVASAGDVEARLQAMKQRLGRNRVQKSD
jgi:hypothetical protein